jgi:hypothetical protein
VGQAIRLQVGWCYARVQTWQIGINGREWLARQMDQAGLACSRSRLLVAQALACVAGF